MSFAERRGWSGPQPLAGDASARHYSRVFRGEGRSAIVMAGASADEFRDFITIAQWLRAQGVSAPEIYEADQAAGEMIIEDFGDLSFKNAAEQGVSEFELYALGYDVLERIKSAPCDINLPDYYASNVHKGRRRIIDWFLPALKKEKNADNLTEQYQKVWETIEHAFPDPAQGFVHIDFHAENLMFRPEEEGLGRCGVLDFQGAMRGPVLYDLANFLEDARREVPYEVRSALTVRLNEEEKIWLRILATQFHCRVIGQFVKLALSGNSSYLCHIPRLQYYIFSALRDPVLAPLKSFFDDLKLDFSSHCDLNIPEISRFIREDAF